MPRTLVSIREKLERANENILNLQREITVFLQERPHPAIADQETEVLEEALNAHIPRPVPRRFSILIGEIIHHLRSCLDNLAWELSSPDKRTRDPKWIEFPIYSSKPTAKDELRRYERKVEGIPDRGRQLIEALQPYHRDPRFLFTGPNAHPLAIIHDMDVVDKHRELILIVSGFDTGVKGFMEKTWITLYRETDLPENEIAKFGRSLDPHSKITTEIAFRQFGGRKIQPVIPGLQKLTRYVQSILTTFENECF